MFFWSVTNLFFRRQTFRFQADYFINMKIEEAIRIFDKSTAHVVNSKELQLKQRFSNILQELKYKELTAAQKELLERELDEVLNDRNLSSEDIEKELQKMLKEFLKSLRVNFSLLPDGYWAGNGMISGLVLGVVLLLVLLGFTESNLKYYAPLAGLLLGVSIGSLCDRSVRKEGRTLLTKI